MMHASRTGGWSKNVPQCGSNVQKRTSCSVVLADLLRRARLHQIKLVMGNQAGSSTNAPYYTFRGQASCSWIWGLTRPY